MIHIFLQAKLGARMAAAIAAIGPAARNLGPDRQWRTRYQHLIFLYYYVNLTHKLNVCELRNLGGRCCKEKRCVDGKGPRWRRRARRAPTAIWAQLGASLTRSSGGDA